MRLTAPRGRTALCAALSAAVLLAGGCTDTDQPSEGRGSAASGPGAAAASRAADPPWKEKPSSLAAVGDSITRGFDACSVLSDCPEVSWVTGSDDRVDSLAARVLPEGASGAPGEAGEDDGPTVAGSWNLARSGARMAELPRQVDQAVAKDPEMLVVLIGANDACRESAEDMTPVADFREDFEEALETVHRELPRTRVLVGSVPDLEQLWRIGRENRTARTVWRLGICPSMLSDPTSDDAEDEERREAVTTRVDAYNEVLQASCEEYDTCTWDGGAVHAYRFTEDQLSRWDYFHPSVEGQAELARILYEVAFGKD